jgi:hypothetical protein
MLAASGARTLRRAVLGETSGAGVVINWCACHYASLFRLVVEEV